MQYIRDREATASERHATLGSVRGRGPSASLGGMSSGAANRIGGSGLPGGTGGADKEDQGEEERVHFEDFFIALRPVFMSTTLAPDGTWKPNISSGTSTCRFL